MALIYCPECKKQISDRAEACPHCGLPRAYFAPGAGQGEAVAAAREEDKPRDDYKTLRNMLISFDKDYAEMFNGFRYIPSSAAQAFYRNYSYYASVLKDPMVKQYVANMSHSIGFNAEQSSRFVSLMDGFFEQVDRFNENFIEQSLEQHKAYFDNMLKKVDPNVSLDEEQRRAVLTDDDYCLLIAGAGAGKTTTMAAKVKYLVDKLNIKPQDIIVISYTNKAIDELKERINHKLKIPVKVCTFHSFGYEILRRANDIPPTVNYRSYSIVFNLLEKKIFNNNRLLNNLVKFLGYYFNIPEDIFNFKSLNDYCTFKANLDYETLKSRLGEYIKTIAGIRKRKTRTITGEFLRSAQEVQIANFLYLHGIDYEYEKPYPYPLPYGRKLYTPDF
ncbi:MAG: UvrD-helicase domain-containing protein [Bacillota bacterium]